MKFYKKFKPKTIDLKTICNIIYRDKSKFIKYNRQNKIWLGILPDFYKEYLTVAHFLRGLRLLTNMNIIKRCIIWPKQKSAERGIIIMDENRLKLIGEIK